MDDGSMGFTPAVGNHEGQDKENVRKWCECITEYCIGKKFVEELYISWYNW